MNKSKSKLRYGIYPFITATKEPNFARIIWAEGEEKPHDELFSCKQPWKFKKKINNIYVIMVPKKN